MSKCRPHPRFKCCSRYRSQVIGPPPSSLSRDLFHTLTNKTTTQAVLGARARRRLDPGLYTRRLSANPRTRYSTKTCPRIHQREIWKPARREGLLPQVPTLLNNSHSSFAIRWIQRGRARREGSSHREAIMIVGSPRIKNCWKKDLTLLVRNQNQNESQPPLLLELHSKLLRLRIITLKSSQPPSGTSLSIFAPTWSSSRSTIDWT